MSAQGQNTDEAHICRAWMLSVRGIFFQAGVAITSISISCIFKLPLGISVLPSLKTMTASAFSGIVISFKQRPHHLWLLSMTTSLKVTFFVSSNGFAASTIMSSGKSFVPPLGTIHVLSRITMEISISDPKTISRICFIAHGCPAEICI